jgi:integrase
VRQFGELWTSGKLYEKHGEVKRLRPKKSAGDDAERLAGYVYPVIGDKLVAAVTEEDIEGVLAAAPVRFLERNGREISAATKRHVYQVMNRLFALAVRPGRLREDSPVADHLKPALGRPPLYGYLFPAELLALLGCAKVPIGRRVLYAMAVYTGLRLGSLRTIAWSGVDFVHGTITSLESKTGLPQMFDAAPLPVELLQAWLERCGRPDLGTAVVRDLKCRPQREAEALRDDLAAAGVTRTALFGGVGSKLRRIRFHDLRATFVTWARRQGRGWGWITDRTGHLTPSQVDRYNRQARTLADLQIEPFPDVTHAIPELAKLPANVRRMRGGGR